MSPASHGSSSSSSNGGRSADQAEKYRRAFEHAEGDEFLGVPMGQVFALAKTRIDSEPDEIEALLENPVHEMRVGAVSIMDFQARRKRTPDHRRKELFELYMRRHDRVDNWDLVDRGLPTSSAAICPTSPATSSTRSRAPRT